MRGLMSDPSAEVTLKGGQTRSTCWACATQPPEQGDPNDGSIYASSPPRISNFQLPHYYEEVCKSRAEPGHSQGEGHKRHDCSDKTTSNCRFTGWRHENERRTALSWEGGGPGQAGWGFEVYRKKCKGEVKPQGEARIKALQSSLSS